MLPVSCQCKMEVERDLALFLIFRSENVILKLISKTWLINRASREIIHDKMSRMEIIREAAKNACECKYLKSDWDFFTFNNTTLEGFDSRLGPKLEQFQGKICYLMFIGRSNCGEPFMVEPFKGVFGEQVFEILSISKFKWGGISHCRYPIALGFVVYPRNHFMEWLSPSLGRRKDETTFT